MFSIAAATSQSRTHAAPAVVIGVTLVVDREKELVCLDFSDGISMETVIRAIQRAEVEYDVVFDLLDPCLWEALDSGTRLYGMLKESIM